LRENKLTTEIMEDTSNTIFREREFNQTDISKFILDITEMANPLPFILQFAIARCYQTP